MEPLRRFWTSKDLSHNDKFLRDYITGKQWKSDDSVPTYSQITGSSGVSRHPDDGGGGGVGSHPMEHQAIDMEGTYSLLFTLHIFPVTITPRCYPNPINTTKLSRYP